MTRARQHLWSVSAFAVLLCVLLATSATAQSLTTTDLQGTWTLSLVSTPLGVAVVDGDHVTSYRGTVIFDAAGAVQGGSALRVRTHTSSTSRDVGGSLSVGPDGTVQGTLALASGGTALRNLVVANARLLVDRHTIVGVVTGTSPTPPTVSLEAGVLTLTKLESSQTFTINGDLAGDWNYYELTPVNTASHGDAAWVQGTITFHRGGLDTSCTDASLTLANGTVFATNDGTGTSFS